MQIYCARALTLQFYSFLDLISKYEQDFFCLHLSGNSTAIAVGTSKIAYILGLIIDDFQIKTFFQLLPSVLLFLPDFCPVRVVVYIEPTSGTSSSVRALKSSLMQSSTLPNLCQKSTFTGSKDQNLDTFDVTLLPTTFSPSFSSFHILYVVYYQTFTPYNPIP